jgi:hypothetical protein
MRGASLLILMGCLLGLPLSGCPPVDPSGEVVGTYDVTGSLVENSCGSAAFAAQDPIEFVVELRAEGHGPAYWRRPTTGIVSGSHTGDVYRFRTEVPVTLYGPDAEAGTAGCILAQVETIQVAATSTPLVDGGVAGGNDLGVPDAGVAAADVFRGESVIELVPTAGSDCLRAVALAGGPFLTLPCRVEYDLSGAGRTSVF